MKQNYESNHKSELADKMLLNYYIVFKSTNNDMFNYSPMINADKLKNQNYKNTMHMLDGDLINLIPGFHYIMHLPRIGFDVFDLDEHMLLQSYDQPHNIVPLPSDIVAFLGEFSLPRPTLIIYTEECEVSAKELQRKLGATIGIASINGLTTDTLKNHWRLIWEALSESDDKSVIDYESLELHDYDMSDILSLVFFSNQFGKLKDVIQISYSSSNFKEKIAAFQFQAHAHLATYKDILSDVGDTSQFKDNTKYLKLLEKNTKSVTLPVVITMPGIALPQINYHGRSETLPDVERKMIKLLGVHRAIARNAVYIELEPTSGELFDELNRLELSCKHERGTNNKYVWRSLKKIGNLLSQKLSDVQKKIISRASHITVFSDFPIGLAILENASAPLSCYKTISYRPLTPLTKAFQYEVHKEGYYYIGKNLRVIIAECLKRDDPIRPASDTMWAMLKKLGNDYDTLEVIYRDVDTVDQLKIFLEEHIDAACLVISAHGSYDTKSNKAGLCIGNEFWMASENDFRVPPIVLLSSCHVSPRGSGAVSVADLFIRNGAVTVMGTFVPVDVRRNGLLMLRLFMYIAETQKGNHDFKTLDEVWTFVISSNAINEITDSNPPLKRWAMQVNSKGTFPLKEFQQVQSVGKLRLSHIYEDTIRILSEMLKNEKLESYFDNIKYSNDFFPESLFYQLIGVPENIFITNPVFEQASEMLEND